MSEKKELTIEELIKAVKFAYEVSGRGPSRGVDGGISPHHASASGALMLQGKIGSQFSAIDHQSPDWKKGFDIGFEWKNGDILLNELLEGIKAGRAVADAVFNWPDRDYTILTWPPGLTDEEIAWFRLKEDNEHLRETISLLQQRIDEVSGEEYYQWRNRKGLNSPASAK